MVSQELGAKKPLINFAFHIPKFITYSWPNAALEIIDYVLSPITYAMPQEWKRIGPGPGSSSAPGLALARASLSKPWLDGQIDY